MQTHEEIERLLRNELDRARRAHEQGEGSIRDIFPDTPPGRQGSEVAVMVLNGRPIYSSTREAYARAVKEFADFVLDGRIPERLKDRDKTG